MERTILLIAASAIVIVGVAWRAQTHAAKVAAAAEARTGGALPAPPIPSPTRKVDEYGDISWSDERARLDNFAIELQGDPSSKGYLICYDGRLTRAGDAQRRCHRAASYVIRHRGVKASRIVAADGGFRERLTVELWVVPRGAIPPAASPTVDPSEVRFIKGRPKRRARHH